MTKDLGEIDALPADQLRALQSLSERQPGQDSNFINIAAAQALTALGLARHGAGGWEIMPLGRKYLLQAIARDEADGAANAR